MIKYKYEKSNLFIGAVFMLVAILSAVVMSIEIKNFADARLNGVATDAIITKIETTRVRRNGKSSTTHTAYVGYEVDGHGYMQQLNYYVVGMYEGKTITVRYDPQYPGRLMSSSLVPIICIVPFVLVFGAVGFVFIKKELGRGFYINNLINEDKYVVVTENGVEKLSNLTVNNVRYRCMHFNYTDKATGVAYKFVSKPYHPDKCPFVMGMPVKVYVDLNLNPAMYFVCDEY